MTNRKPEVGRPTVPMPQENSPKNDPNAMELNRLSADEYRKRWAGGLCFKCGKKGLARDCPQHNKNNRPNNNRSQQGQYQQRRLGRLLAIEAAPEHTENQGANIAITRVQELDSQEPKASTSQSNDTTQETSDFLHD